MLVRPDVAIGNDPEPTDDLLVLDKDNKVTVRPVKLRSTVPVDCGRSFPASARKIGSWSTGRCMPGPELR